jgi:hypothetical protein
MTVIANCPTLTILRVPRPMPAWRRIVKATTTLMMSTHGCRKKDIFAIESTLYILNGPGERSESDKAIVQRLELAYERCDFEQFPMFCLYDWSPGSFWSADSFVLVRAAKP